MSLWHNTYLPITNITQPSRIRPGGLCSIVAVPIQNIDVWPDPDPETGIIQDDIELLSGKSFLTIYCADKDRTFREELKYGKAGPYMDIAITAMVPGNVVDTTLSLAEKQNNRWLLIAKDKNGEYRIVGSQDAGAILTYDYSSGDFDSSRKRNLKFSWQHPNPAPIYQGQLVNELPGTNSTFMFIERFKVKTGQSLQPGESIYTNSSIANKSVLVFLNEQKVLSGSVNDMLYDRYVNKTLSSSSMQFVDANGDPLPINENDNIEIYAYT